MEINTDYRREHQEITNENGGKQSTMRCIRCPDCGARILMLPTLSKMVEAIENHVSSHRQETNHNVAFDQLGMPALRTNLTEQVILQASEMPDIGSKPPIWL